MFTGSLLPKEGTLVSVTENLGRTLLLVEFARGHREYVFENEVEFEQPPRELIELSQQSLLC